jgi:hypothetical protein
MDHALDGRGDVANLAGRQLVHRPHIRGEHADLLDIIGAAVGHQQDPDSGADAAVGEPDVDHHPLVGVVERVEHERLERRHRIAEGSRDAGHDGLQHLGHSGAVLGGNGQGVVAVQFEVLADLCARAVHVGGGQIDLVDHRDDGEIGIAGQIVVGQGLGLDPLGGVDDEERALAGGQGPRDLVGEIDVPGGVDEVERVLVAVAGPVEEPYGVGLDGDPPLALEIHGVEHLIHGLLGVHGASEGEQPVG